MQSAAVTLLHVIPEQSKAGADGHRIDAEELLDSAINRMGLERSRVTSLVREGDTKQTVLNVAEEQNCDLIVMGSPLDRVYPRHHHALQEEVAQKGLLLSERQPGESVQPGHFAARNRLLVSLSCALVVVECSDRSGALISARLAAEQQCPVWVVPGDAGRWSSRGSNRLLQNAAAPLLSPKELVEHLGPGPCHKANATAPALVKALGAGASIEQLQQTLKLPAGRLASDLLELELAGQVVCESGFLWKPCRP